MACAQGDGKDGTCDACEPDEAAKAVMLCPDCEFSFCHLHAEEHGLKYRAHRLRALALEPTEARRETALDTEKSTVGEERPQAKMGKKVCQEHGQELSLYCREHEQIICVLCAVTGAHQGHDLITLNEAYRAVTNREPADLRAMMLERVASLKDKCTDPHVTQREMKAIIEREFDDMHHLAREEERRALHLLDLQDAVASAHMSEVLAEIKGVVEMAKIIKQLNVLSEPALLKPENQEQDPRNGRPPPDPPQPGSNHRCFRDPPSANGPW
uniref:Tripartite motif-containing protein 44 isoform X1 n=1 Tax=Geotrypetes seraphini TaxID=260995 RepID=A0A6P8QCY3_GEOSA|nr:tripartite motif-containing protein 44 isoform X1 [Geotrypetes seraphini]